MLDFLEKNKNEMTPQVRIIDNALIKKVHRFFELAGQFDSIISLIQSLSPLLIGTLLALIKQFLSSCFLYVKVVLDMAKNTDLFYHKIHVASGLLKAAKLLKAKP